ncbi:MAG: gamma-glutamylcyclotransferase family protein [Casimicrobiaceae bacterium]
MSERDRLPRHIFTYGSLMFERVWRRVVQGAYASEPGEIRGFRRLAVKDQDYPAIVADRDGGPVGGVLYRDVSPEDVARLDQFETDAYVRLTVPVFLASGNFALADAYVATPAIMLTASAWDVSAFATGKGIERFEAGYMSLPGRLDKAG